MPREEVEQGLMPSLIDRLIDPDSGGTAWRRGYGLEQMSDAVRRDLEDLLNTRQTQTEAVNAFPEVANSIVAFGLPDLVSLNSVTPQQRAEIGRLIETIVFRFEPRLKDVRASMIDEGDSKERKIRFRIDARLCVDPAPEVAFDTMLELTTGHYSVKQSES